MQTRMYHRREPLSAATDAERLANYRIEQIGCRYVVLRLLLNGNERKECIRPTREDAVEYLFGKLPAVEGEL